MDTRNPYVLLGIPFGASRDVANAAFARRAKRLRRDPNGAQLLTDLTWALNQVDEVLRHPQLALDVYRVPADPSAFLPNGAGFLNPPPEKLQRRTRTSEVDHAAARVRSSRELLQAIADAVAANCRPPDR